jgi:hypothetical protein
MPEIRTEAAYAAAVVGVLREHFPNAADLDTWAQDLKSWIVRQQRPGLAPFAGAEFIVDDPWSARWRLRPCREDHRRVRLYYCPVTPPGSAANAELERTVNDALKALEP